MDFGRITVDDSLILYLFGTPGQARFWFMWDELARGSVGAVVLVDLRRVDDCFPAVDYFENRRLPFVVAVNRFPGSDEYSPEAVSEALALPDDCPVVWMDARDPASSRETLINLVEHALSRTGRAELTGKRPGRCPRPRRAGGTRHDRVPALRRRVAGCARRAG